jgi:hypothetical protein
MPKNRKDQSTSDKALGNLNRVTPGDAKGKDTRIVNTAISSKPIGFLMVLFELFTPSNAVQFQLVKDLLCKPI